DHAPEDLVTAWRQRGHARLEQRAVLGVDARIPVVDPPLVAVLDAERAEHGLDRPVEPDADRARRVYRVPDARLRMVGERVGPRRGRREQEHGRQQPRAHYPVGGGLNAPSETSPRNVGRAAGRPRAGPRAPEASIPEIAPPRPALEPRSQALLRQAPTAVVWGPGRRGTAST